MKSIRFKGFNCFLTVLLRIEVFIVDKIVRIGVELSFVDIFCLQY